MSSSLNPDSPSSSLPQNSRPSKTSRRLWRLAALCLVTLVMMASFVTRQFASADEAPEENPVTSATLHSLVAGTMVSTENGPRAIETLAEGDLIWAEDEAKGQVELKAVTALSQGQSQGTLQLTFSNSQSIQTTAGHQFYLEGNGFKNADQLAVGDSIVTKAGAALTITAIQALPQEQTVYALSLAQFGTYYVGASEIWVRN